MFQTTNQYTVKSVFFSAPYRLAGAVGSCGNLVLEPLGPRGIECVTSMTTGIILVVLIIYIYKYIHIYVYIYMCTQYVSKNKHKYKHVIMYTCIYIPLCV